MTSADMGHFEDAKSELKGEHDSMAQRIKEEIGAIKKKALSKV